MDFSKYIGVIEGFPKAGISFKDISPLLRDKAAFHEAVKEISDIVRPWKPDVVIGPESRGFIFGASAAYEVGCGFAMARKKGKLPGKFVSKTYDLEYSTATIELPSFVVHKGDRVVLIDDLLATGGTLKAVMDLVEELGGQVVGVLTFIELTYLDGKKEFTTCPYRSILKLQD